MDKETNPTTFRYFQLDRIPERNPKPEYGALRSKSCRTNVTSQSRWTGYVTKITFLIVIGHRLYPIPLSGAEYQKQHSSCENLLQAAPPSRGAEVKQVTNGWATRSVLRRANQAELVMQG